MVFTPPPPPQNCAFIEFSQKEAARSAIKETHNMRLPCKMGVEWMKNKSFLIKSYAKLFI